jgi:ADP-heptose:LPS heptosyltransferase
MGGKAREKDWGVPNWRALLLRLGAEHPDAGLVIVGSAEDSERARRAAEVWKGQVVDACGKLSPRESAAAMRRATLFIGHDSGPLHLAAAAGVRCIGLFGSLNAPNRWHPRGAAHRIIHRMMGLETITVGEVMDAVRELAPPRKECA